MDCAFDRPEYDFDLGEGAFLSHRLSNLLHAGQIPCAIAQGRLHVQLRSIRGNGMNTQPLMLCCATEYVSHTTSCVRSILDLIVATVSNVHRSE